MTFIPRHRQPIAPGVGVALVTLFDHDGTLMVERTAALAQRLIEHGAASVMVAGTTGEFWALRDDERLHLVSAVRHAVGDHVPVIGHVGGVSTDRTTAMATRMESAGASAVIALPLGAADSTLHTYYREICVNTDLPVMAYNLPQAGASIPTEQLEQLPVTGIKDSSGDGARLVSEVVDMGLETYTGAPSLLGLAHEAGATGAILGLANVFPERTAAAFAGDRGASITMIPDFTASERNFPADLKAMTARRWGTPDGTRR
ncbi:dihydrodipicolinate synthase family protein (plasmid) [Rhodococcoides fascians]|uniref:dihydrodipicolinate synthase family protein n=1 Tax=Rhodococcoides fascians TaxID=1828 RepID=UPI00389ADF77